MPVSLLSRNGSSDNQNEGPTKNSGNAYLHFDGSQSFIEIPDSPDFSLTSTGALTVSAWIRPATLTFPSTEGKGVELSRRIRCQFSFPRSGGVGSGTEPGTDLEGVRRGRPLSRSPVSLLNRYGSVDSQTRAPR